MKWTWDHERVGLLSLYIVLIGIFISPVLMSCGMILLFINFLSHPNKVELWRTYLKTPVLYLLSLYFLLYLFSGLYSENTSWLINRLQLKLPFLVVPLGILPLLQLPRKYIHLLLAVFQAFMFFICGAMCVWYILHYDAMNIGYQQGKVLPTPVEHIRFSLMVVLSCIIGLYLHFTSWRFKYDWEKYIYLGLSIFFFVFSHILAVRSGLVALYGSMTVLLFLYILRSKNYLIGFAGLILAAGIAYGTIQKIPSLKSKWDYTWWSLNEIRNDNDLARLSDSYRIASIKAGIATGMKSPIIGVGIGDVKDETAMYVAENYPALSHITYTPQNQYVVTFAGLGLLGVVFFILMTLSPFLMPGFRDDIYAIGFHVIAIFSFLIEQTLESQVGIAFYLVFSMISLILLYGRKEAA